ncbi:MAG: hypothetical protein ACI4EI_01895 [Muricoprocola sp.]
MEASRRIYLSRIAEKIDENRIYAEKLGIKNKSKMKKTDEKKDLSGT